MLCVAQTTNKIYPSWNPQLPTPEYEHSSLQTRQAKPPAVATLLQAVSEPAPGPFSAGDTCARRPRLLLPTEGQSLVGGAAKFVKNRIPRRLPQSYLQAGFLRGLSWRYPSSSKTACVFLIRHVRQQPDADVGHEAALPWHVSWIIYRYSTIFSCWFNHYNLGWDQLDPHQHVL